MPAKRKSPEAPSKARRKKEPAPPASESTAFLPPMSAGMAEENTGLATTGRFIVVFKEDAAQEVAAVRSMLSDVAGLSEVISPSDYAGGAISGEDLSAGEAVHFHSLGIAVVSDEDAAAALAASAADTSSPILVIEPEYVAHLSSESGLALEYLRGYRDAVNHLYERLTGSGEAEAPESVADIAAVFQDNAQFTWGLQATRVSTSARSGLGIRVAVLDTGMDLQHPDFVGRPITSQSFVAGVTVQDVHGHGTHCIGTACGPRRPASGVRRYGVAFDAQIFAGKVFNNAPKPGAATRDVIAGIEWAMTNGCKIVSLSLGVPLNQKIMQYEAPMRRALNAGTLVVAAAGNNAGRPSNVGFVEPPANADAAMAVAAVDRRLRIASFSSRSSQVTGEGGIVNLAAPGVAVFSSFPVSRGRHAFSDGTSMATPHVAGIAALWAQATGESGQALWNRLLQSVRPLGLPSLDVGAGLAQAPQ